MRLLIVNKSSKSCRVLYGSSPCPETFGGPNPARGPINLSSSAGSSTGHVRPGIPSLSFVSAVQVMVGVPRAAVSDLDGSLVEVPDRWVESGDRTWYGGNRNQGRHGGKWPGTAVCGRFANKVSLWRILRGTFNEIICRHRLLRIWGSGTARGVSS